MHRPEEMHKHMGGSTEAAKENCCSLVKMCLTKVRPERPAGP